jgi:hypothetical protein
MQYKKYALYSVPLLLLSSIVLCLLFSAYDASTSTMPVAHAQPVIDTNLTRQGEAKLQTYRDWITLMQKYGGMSSPIKSTTQPIKTLYKRPPPGCKWQ